MISTKGRYALRVMIDLAEHEKDGHVPLKDVAERQQLSKKYLEIIVKDLVHAGFVKGVSGKGGGYSLCRSADEYTVGEILEQMEGTLASVACTQKNADACPRAGACQTLPMWTEFDNMVHDYFFEKKLSDLI